MTPTDHDRLRRDLVTLPRGSAAWRKSYAKYRRTEWWRNKSCIHLALNKWCAMHEMMGMPNIPSQESHHRRYAFFQENIHGGPFRADVVALCKSCHLNWEQRRMRRTRR